jgi:hypothetical protein
MTEPALRFNEGKPEISRILKFGHALDDLAAVMAQGGIKYHEDNWLDGGQPIESYLDAAARHLRDAVNGAVYDADLGTKVLAKVAWNVLAALQLCPEVQGPSIDPDFDQEEFVKRWTDSAHLAEAIAWEDVQIGDQIYATSEEGYPVTGTVDLLDSNDPTLPIRVIRDEDKEMVWVDVNYSPITLLLRPAS